MIDQARLVNEVVCRLIDASGAIGPVDTVEQSAAMELMSVERERGRDRDKKRESVRGRNKDIKNSCKTT